MTITKLITLLAEHGISLDTPMISNSSWEAGGTDMDGVFYNPYTDEIEFTQGRLYDLEDHLDWVCLSLETKETSLYVDDDTIEYFIDPETHVVNRRRVQRIPWYKFAKALAEEYDVQMVYTETNEEIEDEDDEPEDDNVVYCPECGEPIYEDDYPEIVINSSNCCVCPICWNAFDLYDLD